MSSYLVLSNLVVQGANGKSGDLIFGFPSMSAFFGFADCIVRETQLPDDSLEGIAVISHKHRNRSESVNPYGDYSFCLTRNPITKEGNTAPFQEEGKIDMTISVMIKFDVDLDDFDDDGGNLCVDIKNLISRLRIAGGDIFGVGQVDLVENPEDLQDRKKLHRTIICKNLPGFSLICRSDLMSDLLRDNPKTTPLDHIMENQALSFQSQDDGEDWNLVSKPYPGYIVPVCTGYYHLSGPHEAGVVDNVRDNTVPFSFVEGVYSFGEWCSPHRFSYLDEFMWKMTENDDGYMYDNLIPLNNEDIKL